MTNEPSQPDMQDPVYDEAVKLFADLFRQVRSLDVAEMDAITVATSSADGYPTARVMLLRGFDSRGFVFFTNSKSRKGQQLLDNPRAALCMYWDALGKQVRVEGTVQRVTDEESDAYWSARRPRSRIASVASQQSERLEHRDKYEARVAELESQYAGDQPIPRPDHWCGFRVVPHRVEFWTSAENRMHERVVYEKADQGWESYLIYP
jgi:pyridoxamine 5'-phosphate oxidase